MIDRRRRYQYIFATFLAVIAVINTLFYFILTRPSQSEYTNLQQSIAQLESTMKSSNVYLADLVRKSILIDRFDPDRNALLAMHMVKRNKGYSEILTKLSGIVQDSGVKWTRQGFNQNPTPQAGLNALSITLPLEGNYANIVQFIRGVEDSETFFLITGITVERTSQASGPAVQPGAFINAATAAATGSVSLSLTLETYFYQ